MTNITTQFQRGITVAKRTPNDKTRRAYWHAQHDDAGGTDCCSSAGMAYRAGFYKAHGEHEQAIICLRNARFWKVRGL